MKRRRARHIGARLVLSLAGITALLSLPLVVALVSLDRQRDDMSRLRDQQLAASQRLGRVRAALEEVRSAERRLMAPSDTSAWSGVTTALGRLSGIGALVSPYEGSGAVGRLSPTIGALARLADSGKRAAATREAAAARSAREQLAPAVTRAATSLNETEREIHLAAERSVARAARRTERALIFSALTFVTALGLAVIVAVSLTRAITRPVADLKQGMEAVSEGRMDHRLATDPSRGDEFGYLAAGFEGMLQRLNELESLRHRWLGHFSHELKNPLGVLRGTLELFGEGIHAELTPQGKEFCDRAVQTSKVLEARILNMIQVAKFQAGHGKLEPRPFPLSAFLRDLDAAFQITAARAEVEFRFVRAGPLPEEVVWDEDRIREVLENLASNAFKFTPKGGRVELRVRSANGKVVFEVADTGAGIPRSAIPKLFNPYYQADNQRKASAKGTGLGLAIAKSIVDSHGGRITAVSEVDKGTTFTVELPVRVAAIAAPVSM
jgi:signal transduction histidine kinase